LRRTELEQLRDTPGGATKIAAIFDEDLGQNPPSALTGSFIQAMIEHILAREFPDPQT
jgi:hypothetical protein